MLEEYHAPRQRRDLAEHTAAARRWNILHRSQVLVRADQYLRESGEVDSKYRGLEHKSQLVVVCQMGLQKTCQLVYVVTHCSKTKPKKPTPVTSQRGRNQLLQLVWWYFVILAHVGDRLKW